MSAPEQTEHGVQTDNQWYIRKIKVNNFKSLVNFELDFSKFTCLIGLNGSGKSTVLQFLDFLFRLSEGQTSTWIRMRDWERSDILTCLHNRIDFEFEVIFSCSRTDQRTVWNAKYDPFRDRCKSEKIESPEETLIVSDSELMLFNPDGELLTKNELSVNYPGSILAFLRDKFLSKTLSELRNSLARCRSLEVLNPEVLRQYSIFAPNGLEKGGENLAAALAKLGDEKIDEIKNRLAAQYPTLSRLLVKVQPDQKKKLTVVESYPKKDPDHPFIFSDAKHTNDGILRLIAFETYLASDQDFLLLDEIENGINAELVEYVVSRFLESPKQVVATTHSPMILNYIPDEIAKTNVIYLYRTNYGATQAIPFFSIPSMAEKLEFMGPGEVFVDTNLFELEKEIQQMPKAR